MERTVITLPIPLDSDVQKVQAGSGMDWLQAYRHVQGRMVAAQHAAEQHRAAVDRCVQAWADGTTAQERAGLLQEAS